MRQQEDEEEQDKKEEDPESKGLTSCPAKNNLDQSEDRQ